MSSLSLVIVRGADPANHRAQPPLPWPPLDRTVKMADMTDSPPLFETNETKLDDLEDDDEDIFTSAVQVGIGKNCENIIVILTNIDFNTINTRPNNRCLFVTIEITQLRKDSLFRNYKYFSRSEFIEFDYSILNIRSLDLNKFQSKGKCSICERKKFH